MTTAPTQSSTRSLATAALLTAVTAVLAQVSIPLPVGVPITLQTFAIALCGYFLGCRCGLFSVAAYLLLGLAGVPVFASFQGGMGVLFGPTGGFLLGFLPMVLLCGAGMKSGRSPAIGILLGIRGLALCHLCGAAQCSAVTQSSLARSFAVASLPYLIKDVLSVGAAYFFALLLRRRLHWAE